MPQDKGSITLKLTPEQLEQVRKATGKVGHTLEFSIMELEDRIAPGLKSKKAAVVSTRSHETVTRKGRLRWPPVSLLVTRLPMTV